MIKRNVELIIISLLVIAGVFILEPALKGRSAGVAMIAIAMTLYFRKT